MGGGRYTTTAAAERSKEKQTHMYLRNYLVSYTTQAVTRQQCSADQRRNLTTIKDCHKTRENRSNWKFAGSWPKLVPLNTRHIYSCSHVVKHYINPVSRAVLWSVNEGGTILKNHSVSQFVTVPC